jgi:hypothetical protein
VLELEPALGARAQVTVVVPKKVSTTAEPAPLDNDRFDPTIVTRTSKKKMKRPVAWGADQSVSASSMGFEEKKLEPPAPTLVPIEESTRPSSEDQTAAARRWLNGLTGTAKNSKSLWGGLGGADPEPAPAIEKTGSGGLPGGSNYPADESGNVNVATAMVVPGALTSGTWFGLLAAANGRKEDKDPLSWDNARETAVTPPPEAPPVVVDVATPMAEPPAELETPVPITIPTPVFIPVKTAKKKKSKICT